MSDSESYRELGLGGAEIWRKRDSTRLDYHRLDGPAYISAGGFKAWWVDGKRHRSDGPAITRPNGSAEWWINGIERSFDEWCEYTTVSDEEIVLLKLSHNIC